MPSRFCPGVVGAHGVGVSPTWRFLQLFCASKALPKLSREFVVCVAFSDVLPFEGGTHWFVCDWGFGGWNSKNTHRLSLKHSTCVSSGIVGCNEEMWLSRSFVGRGGWMFGLNMFCISFLFWRKRQE